MLHSDCKVGMKVMFGRDSGEKTLGEVVKVNPTKCKVKQLETRGSFKAHPVGTIWTVPPSLMSPADGSTVTAPATLQPLVKFPPNRPASLDLFKVGDTVSFQAKGRTFTGTVKSVNVKTVSVDTPTGNWRVSPGLLKKVDASTVQMTGLATTPPSILKTMQDMQAAGMTHVVIVDATKRPEGAILRDILGVYSNLSPENLTCDGELSRAQVVKRRALLNARLRDLEAELGRKVSEDEAWAKFGTYGK